jgi:hypothetical protein
MNTGEREEEQVESIVPHGALEQHETYAAQFVWATGLTLFVSALMLLLRRQMAIRGLALAAVAGTLIVAAAAIRVGHAGGRLVYAHNAGAAYSGNNARSESAGPAARECTGQASSRKRRGEDCTD